MLIYNNYQRFIYHPYFTQLAGLRIRCTVLIPASKKECLEYGTKLYLMGRSQFWRSREHGVPSTLQLLRGQLWFGVVVLVWVPSLCKNDLLKYNLYSIGPNAKKKKKAPPQFLRNNYTKNVYMNIQWTLHWLVGLLVVWVLWHVNFCWLFNAKSIFIQIISSVSNNSV